MNVGWSKFDNDRKSDLRMSIYKSKFAPFACAEFTYGSNLLSTH